MSEESGAKIVRAANVEHYTWGGPEGTDCDGWHLVRTAELSIIEESMPPGTSERRHHHVRTRQFFFVLEGELTVEVEWQAFLLRAGDGLEVAPGQAHQAMNRGAGTTRFMVTSQPPSHGDRVE